MRRLKKVITARKMNKDKFILDACCGGRHIWFDKDNKKSIFMDIREVNKGEIELQPNWCVKPDVIGDYTDMPFEDNTFKLIVWDIPHKIKNYKKSIISKKYGYLGEDWQNNTKKGFNECMRILDNYGVLEFKFADIDIPIKEILGLFPIKPLFGTVTKKGVNNTYWFCFMNIPDDTKVPENDNMAS